MTSSTADADEPGAGGSGDGVASRIPALGHLAALEVRSVNTDTGKRVRASFSRPEQLELDGEGIGEATAFTIAVDPGALTARVPRPASTAHPRKSRAGADSRHRPLSRVGLVRLERWATPLAFGVAALIVVAVLVAAWSTPDTVGQGW